MLRHRLRALVVDDNEANRAFASAALEDESFEVEAVPSAAKALTSFITFQPDCVLLDVRMPDKDGFAACRELRALPDGSSSAIIFLTAARNPETFESAVAAGADDFLTKPVMANELVARVCAAVRAKALSKSVLTLHSVLSRYRAELVQSRASNSHATQAPFTSRTLDELLGHVEWMLELNGDLTRGALEESIASQSGPIDGATALDGAYGAGMGEPAGAIASMPR